jgi:hypothetical protein
MNYTETYLKAKRRAAAQFGFYIHFAVYVCVNLLLVTINYLETPEDLWFMWPLLGWGIGLVAHGVVVFGSERLIQRMVEQELAPKVREQP